MTCTVYCLVPDNGQVEPLVDRIKQAGVDINDTSVVFRPVVHPSAPPPATKPDTTAQATLDETAQPTPLLSALLWWPLLLYANNAQAWQPPDDDSSQLAVIPLAVYLEKCP